MKLSLEDATTLFHLINGTITTEDQSALSQLIQSVKKIEEEAC